jgi:O-antigen ligase
MSQQDRVAGSLAGAIVAAPLLFNFAGGNAMAYFVMAMGICAVIWSIIRRRPIWRPGDQPARMMFLGAYLLLAAALALTSRSPADFRYAGNFLMFLFFVAISTYLGRFAARGNIGRVTLLALAGAALSLSVALFQALVLKQDRAYGIGSDPIWSAQAAIVVGFIAAAGYLAEAPLLPRPVFLLGPAFATITVFLTGSRGPLLAVPLLALIVVLLIGKRARWIFLAGLALAAVALFSLNAVNPTSFARIQTLAAALAHLQQVGPALESSASIRLTFWQIGVEAFLRSPLIGYGWQHFLAAAYAYLPDHGHAFETQVLPGNIHLHSDILDMGVSGGLLGLTAYALVILAPVVDALTSPRDSQFRPRRLAAILLSTGYFVCGLTYLTFGYEFHTTLYTVLAAIILSFCRDAPPEHTASWPRSRRPARR